MRAFTIACLPLLCLALGVQTASAQVAVGDLPPEFFGAQRGRAVARPHGGFRLRYGRGLTPQGAEVISTAITTLGPLIPQIISPMGVPLFIPADPAAADPSPHDAQRDCEPLEPDPVLDALADATAHSQHVSRLDEMSERMNKLVTSLGRKPALPPSKPLGDDAVAVEVVPGGIIDRPQSDPPSAAPSAAAKDCAPTGDSSAAGRACGFSSTLPLVGLANRW